MNDQSTFWFGAKRYGYGWGLPVRWQGWAVLAAYLAMLYGGIAYFKSRGATGGLLFYLIALSAILVAVIVAKGERPARWRWGKK